jgi:hypothetical protein
MGDWRVFQRYSYTHNGRTGVRIDVGTDEHRKDRFVKEDLVALLSTSRTRA